MSVERNADVAQGEIFHAYLVSGGHSCANPGSAGGQDERYQRISASAGVLRDRRVFARVNSVMDKTGQL